MQIFSVFKSYIYIYFLKKITITNDLSYAIWFEITFFVYETARTARHILIMKPFQTFSIGKIYIYQRNLKQALGQL
jgi:hypothetical protein